MNDRNFQRWLENRISERGDVAAALVLFGTPDKPSRTTHWPADQPHDDDLLIAARARLAGVSAVADTGDAEARIVTGMVRAEGKVIGALAMRLTGNSAPSELAANDLQCDQPESAIQSTAAATGTLFLPSAVARDDGHDEAVDDFRHGIQAEASTGIPAPVMPSFEEEIAASRTDGLVAVPEDSGPLYSLLVSLPKNVREADPPSVRDAGESGDAPPPLVMPRAAHDDVLPDDPEHAPTKTAMSDPARPAVTDAAADDALLPLMRIALAPTGFDRIAATLATGLAAAFSCDRVFVGMTRRKFSQVEGISHGAHLARGQALGSAVAAAMDEAIDQSASILCPQLPDERPRITLAHVELLRQGNGMCVLTVPMFVDGQAVGALTCERPQSARFDARTVRRIEHAAAELAPLLMLRFDGELSPWSRQRNRLSKRLAGVGRTRRMVMGGTAVASVVALALLLASHWTFEISAPTRLEGRVERAVVAPIDGFLKTVQARAGDTVREGQVLAELSDEDLQLERQRWETEIARHESGYAEALAKQDRAQLVIASSRVSESRAQLALVNQQIARTQLVAPFDGVVIKGDLTQQLGAPLKRGDLMFSITPTREYRVMLEIDERDVGAVVPGAHGALALSALPDRRFPLVVERVMPVARTESGRNTFEAEAGLVDDTGTLNALLRPGLQGVARLDAGERSLAWLLSHRLTDWLRLQWWEWFG